MCMSEQTYQDKIEAVNALVREGSFADALAGITKLRSEGPPRNGLLPLSNLARRSGAPLLALVILKPLFRAEGRMLVGEVTDEERVAYAASLAAIGAYSEADSLLNVRGESVIPEAHLQKGFCYLRQWDYKRAIPCLEDYLKCTGISDYQRLVAKVNLCSAHLFLGSKIKFTKLSKECLALAGKLDASLMKANLHEMLAQFYLERKQDPGAEEHLALAEGLLAGATSIYSFYVRKWKLVLELERVAMNRSNPAGVIHEISQLQDECRRKQYWEVVRDCDYQILLRFPNQDLFNRLWYRTPFESYRKRMSKSVGPGLQASDIWVEDRGTEKILDLERGLWGDLKIPIHKKHWELVRTLMRDFYRPTSMGVLFSTLFPGEVFSATHSPKRIHQSLSRLRHELSTYQIPIIIEVVENEFKMREYPSLRLYLKKRSDYGQFSDLEQRILDGEFGSRFQVKDFTKMASASTILRILRRGVAKGILRCHSQGSATYYTLLAKRKTK